MDDIAVVHLDQSANNSEGRKSQVLKRPPLAHSIEEGIEEKRNVRFEEERPGLLVGSDALE